MKRTGYLLWQAALLLCVAGCASHNPDAGCRVYFPELKLSPNEYIQDVELTLTNGNIVAVNRLPDDWDLQITRANPLQYLAMHAGHFNHGLDNLHCLDGFISLDKPGKFFGINVRVTTQIAGPDSENEHLHVFNRSDLVFKDR